MIDWMAEVTDKIPGLTWAGFIMMIMAILKVITNLIPGKWDNKVFKWLDYLVDLIVPDVRTEKPQKGKEPGWSIWDIFRSKNK